jgi:hypothetical protein
MFRRIPNFSRVGVKRVKMHFSNLNKQTSIACEVKFLVKNLIVLILTTSLTVDSIAHLSASHMLSDTVI